VQIRVRIEGHYARLLAPRRPKQSHPGFVLTGGSEQRLQMREHTPHGEPAWYTVLDRTGDEWTLQPETPMQPPAPEPST
jgi:hypothetical protein